MVQRVSRIVLMIVNFIDNRRKESGWWMRRDSFCHVPCHELSARAVKAVTFNDEKRIQGHERRGIDGS